MEVKKNNKILLVLMAVFFILGFCHFYLGYFKTPGRVMVVSLSSDGRYAVSSHQGNFIILWNLKNRRKIIISRRGNIYSPYFIKNKDCFIWQGLNHTVYVQNVEGERISSFKIFPVYGELMSSNLKDYFASDINWNLYKGYGKQPFQMKKGWVGFLGAGKLLNLTLSNNGRYLLTSGDAMWSDFEPLIKGKNGLTANGYLKTSFLKGVVLWNVEDGQPLYKLFGNNQSVFATISPDGKYVVAGDELMWNFGWKTKTGEKFISYYDPMGIVYYAKGHAYRYSKGFPKYPSDFFNEDPNRLCRIIAIKFISNDCFLRFYVNNHFAMLFKVDNPMPQGYLNLGTKPYPSVNDFDRDQAIDTAPLVHILVTGQQYANGINVYRYYPKDRTLTKLYIINL